MQKKSTTIDRYTIGVITCLLAAILLIVIVWWYYDERIGQMEKNIEKRNTFHSTTN